VINTKHFDRWHRTETITKQSELVDKIECGERILCNCIASMKFSEGNQMVYFENKRDNDSKAVCKCSIWNSTPKQLEELREVLKSVVDEYESDV